MEKIAEEDHVVHKNIYRELRDLRNHRERWSTPLKTWRSAMRHFTGKERFSIEISMLKLDADRQISLDDEGDVDMEEP